MHIFLRYLPVQIYVSAEIDKSIFVVCGLPIGRFWCNPFCSFASQGPWQALALSHDFELTSLFVLFGRDSSPPALASCFYKC